MSTEPFLATRLSVFTANDANPLVCETNQFRGDRSKKKGKSKADAPQCSCGNFTISDLKFEI
jgi:hypothetical protein